MFRTVWRNHLPKIFIISFVSDSDAIEMPLKYRDVKIYPFVCTNLPASLGATT